MELILYGLGFVAFGACGLALPPPKQHAFGSEGLALRGAYGLAWFDEDSRLRCPLQA